jgi:urease accessory protein
LDQTILSQSSNAPPPTGKIMRSHHPTSPSRARHINQLLASAICLLPTLCHAHEIGAHHPHADAIAALMESTTHPFTGIDHLFGMLAVGFWGAWTNRHRLAPSVTFAMALVWGAWLSLSEIALPTIEPMVAASLCIVGLLLASKTRLSWPASLFVAGLVGVFHGAPHGLELAGPHVAFSLGGMLIGSLLIQASGHAMARWLRDRHTWLPQLAGAGVALLGMALLWGR